MEHVVVLTGFWIFMIVAVVKWGDVKRARALDTKQVEDLSQRVSDLETQIDSLTAHMIELKDGHDFATKLLEQQKTVASN